MKFRFNSVVFHTKNLQTIRSFYEGKLGFEIGTYEKNGLTQSDCSENYVNYQVSGGLIGFEKETGNEPIGIADLVIQTENLKSLKEKIKNQGIEILKEKDFFFIISDPENRKLIFEADLI